MNADGLDPDALPWRVAVRIADEALQSLIVTHLAAMPEVEVAAGDADLLITDDVEAIGTEAIVVVLAGADTTRGALEAGAAAVLPRDVGREALRAALAAVMRGLAVVDARALRGGSAKMLSAPRAEPAAGPELTARELEVLAALAEGASNKEIARRLGISPHTAKFHVASILEKLDATGRTDAVTHAVRLGLIML
jgi:DNA-binding NarL/FixJ family response regulator